MRRLAVLSMHTSPLAQPGTGDGGGMNVYVRELTVALARWGVECDVFTRAESASQPATVDIEPGFRVHHIKAGPLAPIDKGHLHLVTDEFTDGVEAAMVRLSDADLLEFSAIHANYWLSGIAGHELKHRLGLPLVSTFHTLDRVKAEASPEEVDPSDPDRRSRGEAAVIGCSDAVLASCSVEVDQLVELYGADRDRVKIIAPGVDHAFFSPGPRARAQRALGLDGPGPLLLFVGRIQPLKGTDIAARVLNELHRIGTTDARLVIVGGPSGPRGDEEVAGLHRLVDELGIAHAVTFVPPQRHELLSTFYRAADCCLVPSLSESFGLVALEAAACGTPVVASAVGGLTTLVLDGETGYLIDGRSVEEFSRAVAAIVTDADLARRLGTAAASEAANYTWSIAANRLIDLYARLTARSLVSC